MELEQKSLKAITALKSFKVLHQLRTLTDCLDPIGSKAVMPLVAQKRYGHEKVTSSSDGSARAAQPGLLVDGFGSRATSSILAFQA